MQYCRNRGNLANIFARGKKGAQKIVHIKHGTMMEGVENEDVDAEALIGDADDDGTLLRITTLGPIKPFFPRNFKRMVRKRWRL